MNVRLGRVCALASSSYYNDVPFNGPYKNRALKSVREHVEGSQKIQTFELVQINPFPPLLVDSLLLQRVDLLLYYSVSEHLLLHFEESITKQHEELFHAKHQCQQM